MANEIFFVLGTAVAIGVLYLFYKKMKQSREIGKAIEGQKFSFPQIPNVLKQWTILAIITMTLFGVLFGFYWGTHGSPTRSSDDVIKDIGRIAVIQNSFQNLDFKTIYYNPESQTWRVSAVSSTANIYFEYDDILGVVKSILPIPTGASDTPAPTTAPSNAQPTANPVVDVSKIANPDVPGRGVKNAKNVIYEYSDYQCPYCGSAEATVKQILARNDTIIFYKEYPLPIHDNAMNASLAAKCANEQNKFWEYHDLLFANQNDLSPANLMALATKLFPNQPEYNQFRTCFETQKYAGQIQKDMQEAAGLGIQGTPSFVVNGNLLAGAYPITEFLKYLK